MGIWKSYDDLEESLSIPELFTTLEAMHDSKWEDRKFAASLQGVDLEKNAADSTWEKIKAKAFSGNRTEVPNDIVGLQGKIAKQKGFGIGMGMDYIGVDSDTAWWD